LNEWAPGASSGRKKYAHEGFECGFVLKGNLIVELGGQTYELKSGDSITFPSTTPHLVRNPTKKMTLAVWVNSTPWIFKNR
jgi:quercetin dioxygenase-like cupin family protein